MGIEVRCNLNHWIRTQCDSSIKFSSIRIFLHFLVMEIRCTGIDILFRENGDRVMGDLKKNEDICGLTDS